MIGVVGPRDSVAQVAEVAGKMAIDIPLVTRVYDDPSAATDLVRELDQSCSVILFTGRVPFAISSAALSAHARLEYIPHEGVDLMRVVARMLIDRPGEAPPRVSVDSVDADVAREIFAELGFPDAEIHAIPLVLQDRGSGFDPEVIAGQHQSLLHDGVTDVALTCLDSVYGCLRKKSRPVIRVRHAQMVVRASVERCILASQLMRAAGSQIAVILLVSRASEADRRQQALFDSLARDAAAAAQAEVMTAEGSDVKLVTTRGAVERWLSDGGQTRPKVLESDFAELVHLGVGLGESVALAERHARKALSFSVRERQPFIFNADGKSNSLYRAGRNYRAREARGEVVDLARRLGLSPVSLQRLILAVQQSDPSAVTAAQLAAGYGVAPRSARRLLTRLTNAGLAEAVGTEQGPTAGRPQTVFKVHLDQLVALATA